MAQKIVVCLVPAIPFPTPLSTSAYELQPQWPLFIFSALIPTSKPLHLWCPLPGSVFPLRLSVPPPPQRGSTNMSLPSTVLPYVYILLSLYFTALCFLFLATLIPIRSSSYLLFIYLFSVHPPPQCPESRGLSATSVAGIFIEITH